MGYYCLYENMGRGFVTGTTTGDEHGPLTFSKNIDEAVWFNEVGLHSFLKANKVYGSMIVYSLNRFCNATDFIKKTYQQYY